jgi:hypothetical protein
MVKRKRDFTSEYRARIARGVAKRLSRSQARGHRKPGEASISKRRAERALEDHKLQTALRLIRQGQSVTTAAKQTNTSPETLKSKLIESGAIEKRGRKWLVKGSLPRRVLIFSGGREHIITVGDFKAASLIGKYMSHVGWFSTTNEKSHLKKFAGKSVTDINGKSYPFETRPNVLLRLLHAGGNSFEQIYRIVV